MENTSKKVQGFLQLKNKDSTEFVRHFFSFKDAFLVAFTDESVSENPTPSLYLNSLDE